ncbi:MAG: response regulator [Anaerolineales bacterium]|nr:response regulator [Anaerolineales bacterium]
MKSHLKVLILEDRPEDAELVAYELKKTGFSVDWRRVENAEDFQAKLSPELDLILADINLPQFDGLTALYLLRESGLDIPFIVVTGTYEEIALECIKQGATDYLLKDRLARLGKAVTNALEERCSRREKEKAEEELRVSEERYRTVFEGVQDAILIEDFDGRIIDVNQQACRMYGYSYEEFVGKTARDLIAPGGTLYHYYGPDASLPEHPVVSLNRRSDGSVFPVELTVRIQMLRDEKIVLLVIRDVSARKEIQAALRQSEQRFRNLTEASVDCILITDADFNITYTNQAAEKVFQLVQDSAAHSLLDLFSEENQEQLQLALQGVRATGEGVVLGSIDPITALSPEGDFPAEAALSSWMVDDNPYYSIIIRDLTEQLEVRHQEQAQHRLAAVGQMAAGIAHDFNNALMPIGLYSEMILKDETLTERMKDQMRTILKQADRAARLTAQILDFSRQALLNVHPIDIQRFIQNLIDELFVRTFPPNIQFEISHSKQRCVIEADPNRMQQVFLNLALNARDAMGSGGILSFQVSSILVQPDSEDTYDLPEGKWIEIQVSDTGSGIPEETVPFIFEPFFTTKSRGKGSGLGLSQVYGIISQHNGFIRVKSEEGQGTTFNIFLPASDNTVENIEVHSTIQQSRNMEAVLVIEDDLANRRTISDILENAGYRAYSAANGDEALTLLENDAQHFDVIICDVLLPGMSGIELIPMARKHIPDIKIIMMTGHPITAEDRDRIAGYRVELMLKPFSYENLMIKIRTLVEKGQGG